MIEAPDWALQTIYDLEHGVEQLEAENARVRNALKEIADGEIYPQEVARAALYA